MRLRLAITFLAFLATAPIQAKEAKWEEFDRYNGIVMFRKEIAGSDLLAYKGNGTVNAPIGKLVSAILDTPRKRQWMSRIRVARVLKRESMTSALEYIHLGLPWPLQDRDFLYHVTTEVDPVKKEVMIRYKSIDDPVMPKQDDKVRAHVHFGNFLLRMSEDGKKTWIEAETHADPKGALPKWAVNLYQKRLPRQSLEGLMKQVKKQSVIESPLVRGWTKPAAKTPAKP